MNKIIQHRELFLVAENNPYLLVPGKKKGRGADGRDQKKSIFSIKIRIMEENCFKTFEYSHM